MRKSFIVALAAGCFVVFGGPARADQKVAILALSKDADTAKQVEYGLRDQYANAHIVTLSVHEAFPITASSETLTAGQIASNLLTQGFSELICVAPTPAVDLKDATTTPRPVVLDCLTIYSSGTYAAGDAFAVNPTPRNLTLGSMKNTGASRYQVQKGMIQVFSTSTGQEVWQGPAHIKIPEDARTSSRITEIVKEVWQELKKAGFAS